MYVICCEIVLSRIQANKNEMRERGKGMNEKKKLDLGQKNYRN
jgi:hypothetical protein